MGTKAILATNSQKWTYWEIPIRSPRPSHLKDPLFNLAKQPNRRIGMWTLQWGKVNLERGNVTLAK
jgi:hypothetical protein